jgi:hypothetical protein
VKNATAVIKVTARYGRSRAAGPSSFAPAQLLEVASTSRTSLHYPAKPEGDHEPRRQDALRRHLRHLQRRRFHFHRPVTDARDVTRDGRVLYDDIFACYSCLDFTNQLVFITPPVPPSAPTSGSGAPASGELLWAAHLAALDELDRSSDDSEEEDRETPADAVFAAYGDE